MHVPLTKGSPSIEEHRYLEGGTVWKARELLNTLGLGLPGLGAESIHFFWEAPTLCGIDSPIAAWELLRVQSVFCHWCSDLTATEVSGENGTAVLVLSLLLQPCHLLAL